MYPYEYAWSITAFFADRVWTLGSSVIFAALGMALAFFGHPYIGWPMVGPLFIFFVAWVIVFDALDCGSWWEIKHAGNRFMRLMSSVYRFYIRSTWRPLAALLIGAVGLLALSKGHNLFGIFLILPAALMFLCLVVLIEVHFHVRRFFE